MKIEVWLVGISIDYHKLPKWIKTDICQFNKEISVDQIALTK